MKDKITYLGLTIAAIMLAGLILNLLGSGKLGTLPKALAGKITEGYGV